MYILIVELDYNLTSIWGCMNSIREMLISGYEGRYRKKLLRRGQLDWRNVPKRDRPSVLQRSYNEFVSANTHLESFRTDHLSGYSGDVTIVFSQRYLSRFQAIAGGVVEKSIERTLQKSAMMFLETGPTIVLVYHELGVRNAKWTSLQPAEIDPKLLKGRVARRVSHRMNRDHLAVLESVQMEVDS